MVLLFLLLFALGISLIIFPLLLAIKVKKKRRISAAQVKRRESFDQFFSELIDSENEKKSNYKLLRYLKLADYPFGMNVFHYRLAQIIIPVAVAAIVAIFYILGNKMRGYTTPFPIWTFSSLVISSLVLPYLFIRIIAHRRKMALSVDIAKFSHRLVVSITDGVPLYYAIKRASRTTKVIKPYIDQMLIEWLDDPKAAIKNFGNAVSINEVIPLVNTLLATWNAPKEKIVELFQQQIRQIDAMRDFIIKKQIEVTPLGIMFVIIIPFFVTCGLMLIPWYKHMMDMLRQAF